ncbi:serine palmitoyltransferase [Pancytospora philotis]|nr:serine palmitoyltransferase [Pancytospora philotis]
MQEDEHGTGESSTQHPSQFYSTIVVQGVMCFFIYLLIRYRFQARSTANIELSKKTEKRLVRDYRSEPLPDVASAAGEDAAVPVVCNFADYDVFALGGRFKEELKAAVEEYGIGTCGPRGFYGTIDIHTELEKKLALRFGKEECVLYSNGYAALQSIVACFCRDEKTVYFQQSAAEPILRGLFYSKAASVAFEDLGDLEKKLQTPAENKYVVVERVGKNSGKMIDLKELIELRRHYGFRIILDESFSMPFLYNAVDPSDYDEIDVVTGMLCYGYPGTGGFACGSKEAAEYQRLGAHSYVFSASMPAYLSKAALCFLDAELDYDGLRERVASARACLDNVVSVEDSPVLLVRVGDAAAMQQKLRKHGFLTGVNGELLRLCVNVNSKDADFRAVARLIKEGPNE